MKPGQIVLIMRQAIESADNVKYTLMAQIQHCPAQRCRTPGNTVRQHKSDWLYSRNDIDLLNF